MTPVTLRAKSPAKINLSLDILGKRPDGYHDLRMVMASVSLFDELTLTLTPCESGTETYTAEAEGVLGDNLAARAAKLYMQSAGITGWSVHVDIEKRIPIGAGLGGGSGNAAAVLRALDGWEKHPALWNNPFLRKRVTGISLQDMALQLGSDVPYCLHGGVCRAEGRGEILTPLPSLPECWIVLCTPPINISTEEMFAKYAALNPLNQALAKMSDNAFEAVIALPEIDEIKNSLTEAGASQAMMSGSGPAVFGIFNNPMQATSAHDKLRARFPKTFITMPV
jgi:4-diphosphocytidyl-2-C-methyl-D-erythritol kinase